MHVIDKYNTLFVFLEPTSVLLIADSGTGEVRFLDGSKTEADMNDLHVVGLSTRPMAVTYHMQSQVYNVTLYP